jgi:hypothetical protein
VEPIMKKLLIVPVLAIAGAVVFSARGQQAKSDNVVVTLCDGVTQMELKGVKEGDRVDRGRAQGFANLFMAEWRKKHPEAPWIMAQAKPAAQTQEVRNPVKNPASPTKAAPPAKQSEIYSRFSARDEFVWKSELDKLVQEGDRIFHNAEAFGGTVGVSCDMCHPHAANTHPETYPKYQVQLQRVALLRDMINWCIQHPTKGKPLPDDDQRLRAMEAYILWQRKGKAIEPGKH